MARLGGDEFAILQPIMTEGRKEAAALAERIIAAISEPYDIEGSKIVIGTSIGIALAPADGVEPNELMKQADLALYRQKSAGRNGYRFFDAQMTVEADARHELVNDLRTAISDDQLELWYQLVVDVKTNEPCGAEALLRWRHPRAGKCSSRRVHSAGGGERTDRSARGVGDAEGLHRRRRAGRPHIKVAVNMSPGPVQEGQPPRYRYLRAGRIRSFAGAAGAGDHRIRADREP